MTLTCFARKCEIRSQSKILDMLDYLYRLNWANVEIKLEGYDKIVDEGILYFSRLALEWVVQEGKKHRRNYYSYMSIFKKLNKIN